MSKMMDKKNFYLVLALVFAFVACNSDKGANNGETAGNVAPTGSGGTAGASSSNLGAGGSSATVGAGGLANGGTSAKNASGSGGSAGRKTGTGGTGGAAGSQKGGTAGKPAVSNDGGASDTCDRKCLIGYISGYLEALVAKDPSKLKVSSTVKFTNNGVLAKLGEEGLWKTASALETDKRLDYADPKEGQVATQTVIDENGTTPVIYQVRLKVVHGEITEVESMEVRQATAANYFFNVANMKPQPVFLQEIEPSKRMNRDQLKTVMELYMDYLEGKKTGAELPFDTNCARYENGQATAVGVASFVAQSSWRFQLTRRYLVFDEEAGIVWGMFPFQQTDTALVVGEAFKIMDGKFMMISAVMAYMPSKAWD
jgi:hypothetical protein